MRSDFATSFIVGTCPGVLTLCFHATTPLFSSMVVSGMGTNVACSSYRKREPRSGTRKSRETLTGTKELLKHLEIANGAFWSFGSVHFAEHNGSIFKQYWVGLERFYWEIEGCLRWSGGKSIECLGNLYGLNQTS